MKTIVCYGDSNTYGYNPENGFRYEYEERWTTILQKELKDSAIVIPEGLNGRTTSFEDELRPGRNGATYLWKRFGFENYPSSECIDQRIENVC